MNAFRLAPRHGQQGVALVIALLILVLISILGVSAMRTSIFNAKIARAKAAVFNRDRIKSGAEHGTNGQANRPDGRR